MDHTILPTNSNATSADLREAVLRERDRLLEIVEEVLANQPASLTEALARISTLARDESR